MIQNCQTPISPIISKERPHLGKGQKIINVGLPKSASTSTTHIFKSAGVSTSHWKCNRDGVENRCGICLEEVFKSNSGNALEQCGNFTMWGEMNYQDSSRCIFPQIQYLEQLYRDAPSATWLMPIRNVSDWLDSVNRAGKKRGRFRGYFDKCDFHFSSIHKTFLGSIDKKMDEKMIDMYCHHTIQIRDFVESHPSLSLIEFKIDDPNVGNLFSSYFDVKADDWGKENENQWHKLQKEKMKRLSKQK